MTSLKELVRTQEFADVSDFELIKTWFVCNGMESEGIAMISELSEAKLKKTEIILSNARTWIPVIPDMYEANKRKITKDTGKKLNHIIQFFLLDLPLPDDLLTWAKDTIPTLNTPPTIFRPAYEWLKNKHGIEFADRRI